GGAPVVFVNAIGRSLFVTNGGEDIPVIHPNQQLGLILAGAEGSDAEVDPVPALLFERQIDFRRAGILPRDKHDALRDIALKIEEPPVMPHGFPRQSGSGLETAHVGEIDRAGFPRRLFGLAPRASEQHGAGHFGCALQERSPPHAGLAHQKMYLPPTWTMRPSPAPKIRPIVCGADRLAFGLLKFGRFGALKASRRSCSRPQRSESVKFLYRLRSTRMEPGPIRMLRPAFPNWPGPLAAKASLEMRAATS